MCYSAPHYITIHYRLLNITYKHILHWNQTLLKQGAVPQIQQRISLSTTFTYGHSFRVHSSFLFLCPPGVPEPPGQCFASPPPCCWLIQVLVTFRSSNPLLPHVRLPHLAPSLFFHHIYRYHPPNCWHLQHIYLPHSCFFPCHSFRQQAASIYVSLLMFVQNNPSFCSGSYNDGQTTKLRNKTWSSVSNST